MNMVTYNRRLAKGGESGAQRTNVFKAQAMYPIHRIVLTESEFEPLPKFVAQPRPQEFSYEVELNVEQSLKLGQVLVKSQS
jgi:hypothetical protein